MASLLPLYALLTGPAHERMVVRLNCILLQLLRAVGVQALAAGSPRCNDSFRSLRYLCRAHEARGTHTVDPTPRMSPCGVPQALRFLKHP
jgi:hypothetical protein